jgi:arsenite-transporting ATPase
MLLNLNRRVIFVGGKGGVGKTTIAGAFGAVFSQRRRCLIVSTDPAHSLGDVFGVAIGDAATRLGEQLWGLEIDPDAETTRHIASVKQHLKTLVHPRMYGEVERQLDLARLAPGTMEAALLERMAELITTAGERFDQVIFDTAPTGHTVRLLSLPEIMAAWTDGLLRHRERSSRLSSVLKRLGGGSERGDELSLVETPADRQIDTRAARLTELLTARQQKLRRARDLLLDSSATAFVLVLNPDKLSILESQRARQDLAQAGLPVAAAVVNRVLPEDADGAFVEARRRQEAPYLAEIEREFADVPRVILPLQAKDVQGLAALRALGTLIAGRE